SKLDTGKAPRVVQVLRFARRPPATNLRGASLADGTLDPYGEDPIKRLVEQRAQLQREAMQAGEAGDAATAERLDAIQRGKKPAASATSYGIPIELNLLEHRAKQPVT